jgi:glycosyltransferase involved in cell wall biosynthesis
MDTLYQDLHDPPLISICIPSYNAGKYIAAAIQSVLDQTYRNFEIIISDDSSDDGTVEVIKSFTDHRIRCFINERNRGVEFNWNKALHLAKGKYVKVLCDDDIIYPECILEQVRILENPDNADVVLVTCHKHVIDQEGKVILKRKFQGKPGKWNGRKAIARSVRFGTNIIGEPGTGLFRAEILEKSGYYNGGNIYMIDLDFWSRILQYGDLYVIDKVLFGFRVSAEALSTKFGFEQIRLFNRFAAELFQEKSHELNRKDLYIGRLMSMIMVMARNLVYLSLSKK